MLSGCWFDGNWMHASDHPVALEFSTEVRISPVLVARLVRWRGWPVNSTAHRIIRCLPNFLDFLFSDLDLIDSSILSSSKCFSEFYSLSWAELEQVCKNSKANSILVKLLTHEPLFIVRSRTENYKPCTKSSVLHLLVTFESRKVLNLEDSSLWLIYHEFWGGCWWFLSAIFNHQLYSIIKENYMPYSHICITNIAPQLFLSFVHFRWAGAE